MVSKKKSFRRVRFPAELVSEVYEEWANLVDGEGPVLGFNEVKLNDDERHSFDTVAPWLDAYRRNPIACTFTNITRKGKSRFNYYFDPIHGSTVEVELPNVTDVNKLIEMFEREAPSYRLPEEPAPEDASVATTVRRPHVFIGYGGRNTAWRDLRDFLGRLGVEVETFQSETRVGQTITDVLMGMLDRANFAFLSTPPRMTWETVGCVPGRILFTRLDSFRDVWASIAPLSSERKAQSNSQMSMAFRRSDFLQGRSMLRSAK
jgi:hypothetical protein